MNVFKMWLAFSGFSHAAENHKITTPDRSKYHVNVTQKIKQFIYSKITTDDGECLVCAVERARKETSFSTHSFTETETHSLFSLREPQN